LIGAGVTSTDIAKESGPIAKQIYQTHRSGPFDLPATILPENAIRVDHVASFELKSAAPSSLADEDSLPITIKLITGQVLCDVDYIILCTGYTFALPFLNAFHNDELEQDSADKNVLVTKDGRQIHNLHKGLSTIPLLRLELTTLDIFYIPDPTLMFIGIPFYTATFSLFDFQAITMAAVVGHKVNLPSEDEMRLEYEERLKEKGHGRHFHSLRDREESYVNELLAWVNEGIEAQGELPVQGHSEKWVEAKVEQREKMKAFFGTSDDDFATNPAASKLLEVCG
jgi:MFS transporter, ACS family, pantothenate transporter